MWWLIAVGAFGIFGVLTSFVEMGMFAVGAAAAAAAAGFGGNFLIQCIVFALVSIALLVFVRPIVVRHNNSPGSRTGIDALKGTSAVVLERVDENGGRIKLAGEVWSARSLDATAVFEPGSRVDVADIVGATAVVM
ncbi:NfeD family protein [Streptomyces sp. SID3343]|uniref:NfeD family protein n=1 Tax=Streptomyces sp. SID3343 TaxID=2690260 RepID=UPI001371894C|nr:NfeD family protein [Streptomyces sp. SID3343]MYW00405.1 NfeD family protein [Streptomyces sp. SID3343]